jgi:hypothetical protein
VSHHEALRAWKEERIRKGHKTALSDCTERFSGGIKVNLGVSDPIEICGRPNTSVQVSSFIAGHGIELFRLAKEKGLEGIMAKRAASTYQAGLFFTGVMGVRIAWSNPWPPAIEHPNVALPIAISRFKAERGASFHQGPVSSFFFLS